MWRNSNFNITCKCTKKVKHRLRLFNAVQIELSVVVVYEQTSVLLSNSKGAAFPDSRFFFKLAYRIVQVAQCI